VLDVDYVVGAYVGVLAETVVLPPSNVVTPLEALPYHREWPR